MTHRVMGVNGEAPACQPPTRSPSPHRVRMAVAEVQMRAAGGPCARRGMLDAGARSRHDVVGTHRSKERLSAAAQRCRAGLVVVSLKDVSHGSGKKFGSGSTVRVFFCKKARDTITTVGRGLGSLSKAVLAIMVVRGKLTRCRILVSVLEDAGTATLHLSRAFVALCAEQAVEMLLAKIQQRR